MWQFSLPRQIGWQKLGQGGAAQKKLGVQEKNWGYGGKVLGLKCAAGAYVFIVYFLCPGFNMDLSDFSSKSCPNFLGLGAQFPALGNTDYGPDQSKGLGGSHLGLQLTDLTV